MILDRAMIVSFDSTTHTANVQLMGSMSGLISAVPAAHHIGPELLTPGTHCILAFARESSDGIILATFYGPPDPWITSALIKDAEITPANLSYAPATPDFTMAQTAAQQTITCLLYTSPSPRDRQRSRMPSSA